jgi:hypothetical protein
LFHQPTELSPAGVEVEVGIIVGALVGVAVEGGKVDVGAIVEVGEGVWLFVDWGVLVPLGLLDWVLVGTGVFVGPALTEVPVGVGLLPGSSAVEGGLVGG